MTDSERKETEKIFDTFEKNFKILELYALYLERFPEIIGEQAVDALTADGDITKREAIVALLSEIFGLDFEKEGDRRLIRDYIDPSVRLLDKKKYENDPYYKNISPKPTRVGNWEIRIEKYPPYRGVICEDMQLLGGYREVAPLGFFTEEFCYPAILEGGNEWMTLTPIDIDTCRSAIAAAHGRVITFGLGLGYFAYMASEKEEVESVTVVELSDEVISLFKNELMPKMAHRDKISIVSSDAFEYAERVMPGEDFDIAFVDTWRDASDGAPMYRRMRALEHLSPNTKFFYWIENFLISRLRGENYIRLREKISAGRELSLSEIEKNLNDL